MPLRQFLLLLPGRTGRPLSLDGVCHSGRSHGGKVVTVVPCRGTSMGVTGLLAPAPRARAATSAPRLPRTPPLIGGLGSKGCTRAMAALCGLTFQSKVLPFQQSETLKTNILPHQESNFLSKQFSLNISKQPRVSIDLNCYKREKNEALSLQRSCLPTN